MDCQLAPSFVLLETLPFTLTYSVEGEVGSTASARTGSSTSSSKRFVQLAPPSTLLKSPVPVSAPTYSVEGETGSIASAVMLTSARLLTDVHLAPPSMLLKTPPPRVPA